MKITSRIGAAWRALTGQRSDPYAATYGAGGTHGFAGGAINRLTASLATFSGSVNADLDGALPVLRARARHLAANNEHGKRFLSLVATNVVGRQNPRLQVRAMKDQRNPLLPTVARQGRERYRRAPLGTLGPDLRHRQPAQDALQPAAHHRQGRGA